jgi:hypothetical protein
VTVTITAATATLSLDGNLGDADRHAADPRARRSQLVAHLDGKRDAESAASHPATTAGRSWRWSTRRSRSRK